MIKDSHVTLVVFRKFTNGTIIALFPHEVCDHKGNVTSYMHVGQHGGANYKQMMGATKRPTPLEMSALFDELVSIGYRVNLCYKQNYNKYLKSYKDLQKRFA